MNQFIKFNTKNPDAVQYGYIPVTGTASYRRQQQKDWEFRLNAELQILKNQNWNIGFITLTYNDAHLPKLPKILFKNQSKYSEIPCFSKTDIQNWIHSVRQYCKYHYNFKNGQNIRYFIASEYGSNTHRPHYHAILAWPNTLDYETMHELCKEKWEHGWVFPRQPQGDRNGTKDILPFKLTGDLSKAIAYCAKYACKDIDFYDIVNKCNINSKHKLFKNCTSFHIQSKSLGFETIKNMSDDEKHKAFIHGISFQGDGNVYKVPVYIKNKIVYDTYYVYKNNGERLVKRKASKFFHKYKYELFTKKAEFYEKIFRECTNYDYFTKRGINEEKARLFSDSINYYKNTLNNTLGFDVFGSGVFGQYYLSYFGIKRENCQVINNIDDAVNQWMRRYSEKTEVIPQDKIIDEQCYNAIQNICSLTLGCNTYCNYCAEQQQEQTDRLNKKIQDYFNNVIAQRII